MLGQLLYKRYQIIEVLNAGAFGQTYVAEDTSKAECPKCVVKHFKLAIKDPNCLLSVRRRFLNEAETLKKLGNHPHIPRLLAYFEEDQEFYLVQEYIEGHLLNEELPISKYLGQRWTESQVLQLFQQVLSILEFIHSQGFIHCDLKPNNLIRRTSDGQLFLIDFGSVQPVRPHTPPEVSDFIGMHPLGYIAAELLIGHAHPNSDIYALGMVGIQALTGLEPSQFPLDLETGEVIWQHQVPISDALTFILDRMVQYHSQDRYQSATEVIQAIQPLRKAEKSPGEMLTLTQQTHTLVNFAKQSLLVKGIGVGLAANTLAIAFGFSTLLNASASDSGRDLLAQAKQESQAGDLEEAIALAKSISSRSEAYSEAQAAVRQWRQTWKTATAQFKVVETAFNQNRWSEVLEATDKLPRTSFWQEKTKSMVQQAKYKVEVESYQLLQKAFDHAENREFTQALNYLKQISKQAPVYAKVQAKLTEYEEKQQIKAERLLQKAYDKASARDFAKALTYLKQVPQATSAYPQAQAKIVEYTQKQQIQLKAQSALQLNTATKVHASTIQSPASQPLSRVPASTTSGNLNWGDTLQEVHPPSREVVSSKRSRKTA